MFYVYDFNVVSEDFEALGAFSSKDEANGFVAAHPTLRVIGGTTYPRVIEQTWGEFLAQATKVALGPFAALAKSHAEILRDLGVMLKQMNHPLYEVTGSERVDLQPVVEEMTFDQRVVAEQKQLGERLFKLRDFLGSKKFNELGDCERARLNRQVTLMSEYFEVLTERLDYAFQ